MTLHARNRIIYLHGYEPKGIGYYMPEIELLVRQNVPRADDPSWVEHWSPLKDTFHYTFIEVAEQLAEAIRDGGGAYSHKDYEAVMDEAAYKQAVLKHLSASEEMLVLKAKSE